LNEKNLLYSLAGTKYYLVSFLLFVLIVMLVGASGLLDAVVMVGPKVFSRFCPRQAAAPTTYRRCLALSKTNLSQNAII
jgi:hypothetical protein